MDGKTDDGQKALLWRAHLSFQLRWAKKPKNLHNMILFDHSSSQQEINIEWKMNLHYVKLPAIETI
jgi:hypothetical protein